MSNIHNQRLGYVQLLLFAKIHQDVQMSEQITREFLLEWGND